MADGIGLIWLEEEGASAPVDVGNILLESSGNMLLELGGQILLEE